MLSFCKVEHIIDRIKAPGGVAWTVIPDFTESVPNIDVTIPPHHDAKLRSEEIAVTEGTEPEEKITANLGPGERPELPSLRARRRAVRVRDDGGSTVTSVSSIRNPLESLRSILDRPDYAPPTVLLPSSARTVTGAVDESCAQSSRSQGTSLSEQQEMLDRELAEIDQRIARIRMGSLIDRDTNATRSHCAAETRRADADPSGSKVSQLTPRDSVVVEGQAVSDRSDKSLQTRPLLRLSKSGLLQVHSLQPDNKTVSGSVTSRSGRLSSTDGESRRTLNSLTEKWRYKLNSIISSQIENLQSERHSGPSSVPSSSGLSCGSWSSTSSRKSFVVPREGGDTPSRSEASSSLHFAVQSAALGEPSQVIESNNELTKEPFNRTEPILKLESKVSLLEGDAISKADHALPETSPVPRMQNRSVLHPENSQPNPPRLSNEECSIFHHISQVACRLAQTALQEATTELVAEGVVLSDFEQSKFRSDHPESESLATKIVLSSAETQSTTTAFRSSTEPSSSSDVGSSTCRSLKAELRALLTSSLISSLLSGSGTTAAINSSTLTGALSSTAEVLRRELAPSPNSGLKQPSPISDDILGSSQCRTSSKETSPIQTGLSGSVSSPSDDNGSCLDGVATVIPVPKKSELDKPDLSSAKGEPQGSSASAELHANQAGVVKVRKNWLIGLLGNEHGKMSRIQRPSAIASHQLLELSDNSSHGSFRPLSPVNSSDASSTPRSTEPSVDSNPPSTTDLPIRNTALLLSTAPCGTNCTHPITFKPLPRLEEAPSEESIADQSNTLINPLPLTLAEGESLQTPSSSSWTGSRKSNEFCGLSRCSTSNSNLGVVSDTHTNQVSESHVETTEDDQTTIHRLRTNVPLTPVEPFESSVVPCLGSNGSASASRVDSRSASVNSSPTPYQPLGTDDRNWPHCVPTVYPSSTHVVCPPVLANETRNTTTIDSSIVWDDGGDLIPNVDPASNVDELGFYGTVSGLTPQPTPKVGIGLPKTQNPELLCPEKNDKTPRPTSPADGVVFGTVQQRPITNLRDLKLTPYASMPVIYVDCDMDSQLIEPLQKPTPSRSVRGALYASWGSFTRDPLPPVNDPSSLSDSLRSFQRHEASCFLLDETVDPILIPVRQSPTPVPRREFLNQSPNRVTAVDVKQNALAIHSVTRTSEDHKRHLGNRPDEKAGVNRRVWDGHSSTRSVGTNRGGASHRLLTRALAATARRVNPSRDTVRSSPPDPLELAMSNVTLEEVRHIRDSSSHKRKSQPKNANRVVNSRYLSTRARVQSSPRRTDASGARRGTNSTTRTATSTAAIKDQVPSSATTTVPRPYSNRHPGPGVTSFLHSSSGSFEQSLREKLQHWRAVRLGVPVTSVPSGLSQRNPDEVAAASSRQVTSSSCVGGTCSASMVERVSFASVQPGPPPMLIERNADDDVSTTTLWMNEIAFQPLPTSSDRPSTPTPNSADRFLNSSDTTVVDEENLETDLGAPSIPQASYVQLGNHQYRPTTLGSTAFFMDFNPTGLPGTACAGDESTEMRFPMNELQ
ncbi:unnamed protein product [Echinostoma caproni]|uniref:Uncharacterized protein n=1 Tax=Echinostoma caproni TaxID=27848 RepID=A0A3P8KC22_9TREM|nr:unnamed protein product [Echinostoma caproni]